MRKSRLWLPLFPPFFSGCVSLWEMLKSINNRKAVLFFSLLFPLPRSRARLPELLTFFLPSFPPWPSPRCNFPERLLFLLPFFFPLFFFLLPLAQKKKNKTDLRSCSSPFFPPPFSLSQRKRPLFDRVKVTASSPFSVAALLIFT